jgi:hypothetical protein
MILLTLGKINRSEILDHLIGPAIVAVVAAIILIVRQQNHRNAYKRTDLAFRRGIVLPEPAPKRLWPWRRGLITSASLAAFYLLAFRGISFLDEFHKEYAGGAILMSFSFLFLGPFVAGFFTVDQAAAREPLPIKQWIIAPWIPILLNLALAIAVYWEGLICAIFIIPPAMILASLGGVTAGFIHRYRHKRSSSTTLLCMAVAPLLLCIWKLISTNPSKPAPSTPPSSSTPLSPRSGRTLSASAQSPHPNFAVHGPTPSVFLAPSQPHSPTKALAASATPASSAASTSPKPSPTGSQTNTSPSPSKPTPPPFPAPRSTNTSPSAAASSTSSPANTIFTRSPTAIPSCISAAASAFPPTSTPTQPCGPTP